MDAITRKAKLDELKGNQLNIAMTGIPLRYKGTTRTEIVYRIPLDYLVYNKYNGRIGSDVLSYEKQNGVLNAELDDDKAIIEKFLYESKIDRNKITMDSLLKNGQQRYGIVTSDGTIVDGNRRAMLLNRLFHKREELGYSYEEVEKCKYFLAIIRPQHLNDFYKDMTENAIREDSCRAIAKRNLMTQFKRAGISKAELSRRAGVAASTITAATAGKPLRLASADAISEALGYTRKELFTVQNDPTPLAKKTILEHHRLISTILSQADKELLIPYNPASKATPPRVQRKTPDYYQPDEMNDILNTLERAPIKWKAITYLLIDTGCRRGEIMGLKWDKVNFDTGVIVIDCNLLYSANRGVYEDTTKTGAVRAIKIAPQTLTVLRQWRVEYEHLQELNGDRWAGTPYVFVRDDGSRMHPDSITAWLNRFSAQNDLPHIHPHAFRHTAASTMIANGVDLVTTAAELGHANANTTATIYAHQIAIARATAAEVRAGVFAGRK